MATQNWQKRQFEAFSPNFRIDTSNPSMGYNGSEVYDFYATNEEGDVSLIGMSEGGILHI